MSRRVALTTVLVVLLLVAGVACLTHGVQTAPSTGGLLVAPVPLTQVLGAWVAGGVALVTAALVCAIDAVARWRTTRAPRSGPGPDA